MHVRTHPSTHTCARSHARTQGTSVEEAQLLLDDHTIKSQAIQSSPAAEAFVARIEGWVSKLTSMQDIFDAWLIAQVCAGVCTLWKGLHTSALACGTKIQPL